VSGYGLVRLHSNNVFVTPNSFFAPTTTAPSIQRGIDAASSGDTVNVEGGTYAEALTINKAITLDGEGSNLVTLTTPSAGATLANITDTNALDNITVRDI